MTEALKLSTVDRAPTLVETVSERLTQAVTATGLEAGARLPSERELAEQLGVSRTVIREAIRHLAAKGVLEVRSGSGVRVAAANPEAVSQSIGLFVSRNHDLSPMHIHQVRSTLELATAELAARNATPEELDAIDAEIQTMAALTDDPEAASQSDVAFHRLIARATHNPLFLVLVDSMSDVLLEIRRATLTEPGRVTDTIAAHQAIADAIRSGESEAATAAMEAHLVDSLEILSRHW
ncbi:FadR/GntR family transcriptional regulator [Aestuariimicrobium ganziense]|uniref:FadR/GntR family transcriptional regulator n=1 Tax=Aestuariimicrobium ganziense TaxID=2773677 RepID=UPI0019450235|nr:FadR/GntR family transcriptional regulator [Aestuariimicrobium ganziense]